MGRYLPDVDRSPARAAPGRPELLVVVGGSAGSLPPLRQLIAGLPPKLPAAVPVTIHRSDRTPSQLPELLGRAGPLPVHAARDGEPIQRGHVYIASPSKHLMTSPGQVRLSDGPRVNRHRPSVDVLFASTAHWSRHRTVAVVLSGVLDDGAVGSALISMAGGRVLVQEPGCAEFDGMPAAALAAVDQGRAVRPSELADGVFAACEELLADDLPATRPDLGDHMSMGDSDDPGFLAADESRLTRLVCPECGGSLAQIDLPQISYFRCHIGHQYAPQTLAAAQAETSETKLWSAVAALEEQAALQRHLSKLDGPAARSEQADRIAEHADQLRQQIRQWANDAATPVPAD